MRKTASGMWRKPGSGILRKTRKRILCSKKRNSPKCAMPANWLQQWICFHISWSGTMRKFPLKEYLVPGVFRPATVTTSLKGFHGSGIRRKAPKYPQYIVCALSALTPYSVFA